jgi:esterase/lipase superfamily enzyme
VTAEWIDGMQVNVYGHWGRPLLALPSQEGAPWDWEANGMVDAVGPLLEAGRVKLYCVSSHDSGSWHRHDLSLEQRARAHGPYEHWIVERVAPWIQSETNTHEIIVSGCSFGAYHAANFYVANLAGDHLAWLRGQANLVLVCGQGQWEDTTGSLDSTKRFAGLLSEKGIRHELDLWGHDVPHDWPSWQAQIAHHLPRFV